jgi:nucleoside triphosphate diphosphatase
VEERKKREAEGKAVPAKASLLAGITSAMPAMLEASKLSARAAQAGFDWPDIEGLFEKLDEETKELREHLREIPEPLKPQDRGIASSGRQAMPEELRERVEGEIGDLFFVLVNLARYLSVDAESALRSTNRKFKRRFQWMEARLAEGGRSVDGAGTEELETLWQAAKREERA